MKIMNKEILNEFEEHKNELKLYFENNNQEEYSEWNDFIRKVINITLPTFELVKYKERGSYQGEIEYSILKDNKLYEGETYYGSCSMCDSLIAISNYDNEKPTKKQVSAYMLLALELIEQLKEVKNNE